MAPSFLNKFGVNRRRLWKTPKPRRCRARLGVEILDERILPSVMLDLDQGILSIRADDNANRVQVLPSDKTIHVLESDRVVGTFPSDQVQLLTFQYGAGVDSYDNETAIPDKQLRLFDSSPLTPALLSQTGNLDALLFRNTLTLAGPSGAGFQVTGNWSAISLVSEHGSITHTFTAHGLMALHTALGNVPFISAANDPLTITTLPDTQLANFGAVDSISWNSGVPLDTNDPSAPLNSLQRTFGLQLSSPSAQFGVALGSDLTNLGVPLNNALAYIYFSTANSQAQFGDIPSQINEGNPLTIVFDPEDPFVYARVNEFAVGVSLKGYIPFTPVLSLPGLDSDPIYGHLYGRGPIALGDIDATVTAEAVINLDGQHDGQLLSAVGGNVASYLLTGRMNLSDLGQDAPLDLRVGLNGHADVRDTRGGFNMIIPVDASAVYTPGHLVAHGTATGDLFAGTPLSFLGNSTTLDVVADISTQSFDVIARADTTTIGGFNSAHLVLEWNDEGITAAAQAHLQYATWTADVGVAGTVTPDGQYLFVGQAQAQFAGFGSANARFALSDAGLGVEGDVSVPIGTQTLAVHFAGVGYIHPDGQFLLQGNAQATFAGFVMPNAAFVLTNSGLTAQGTITAQIGTGSAAITFAGYIHPDGQFNVTGTAQAQFSGFVMPNAAFVLNNSGLAVAGDINVRLGSVTLPVHFVAIGYVQLNGQFNLDGHANATFAGFASANAHFVLNNSGLTADGTVNFQLGSLGYSFPFTGWVHADGQFQLTGHVAQLNFAGFVSAGVDLILNNAGLSAVAFFHLGSVVDASLTGTIYTNGQFTLTGNYHVSFAGFGADASFTLTTGGVSIAAGVAVPYVTNVRMAGSIQTNGQFLLNFSGSFGINGFGGSGWLRLDNNGVTAHLDVGFAVLGLQAHLDGYIHSNGQFQLTAAAGLSLGPINGNLSLTLNNSGFRAQVHAGLDLRARINGPFGLHLDVGFLVAVDVGFAINTNGTFQANGSFTATAYLGISISLSIGFSLDNHTFTIHTHDIGFSVWGISFHPFGDTVVHY
jgi:hypothetical protein